MTTDADYRAAAAVLAELDRDYAAAFPAPLIHTFARAKWTQIQGGKWRSEKGRVLSNEAYQRHQARLKSQPAKGPAHSGATQIGHTWHPPTKEVSQIAPPLHPIEAAHLDEKKASDTTKYGPEHAGFLHRAAHAVRSALAAGVGGLTAANGAAYGALAGGAVGGPLGMALGTAVGGGLGLR